MCKVVIFFLLIFNPIKCGVFSHLSLTENSSSNLPSFICNAVDQISKHDVETVAIAKFDSGFSSGFFDNLYKCMPTSVTIVQINLTNAEKGLEHRDIKFVVIIGDDVDKQSFVYLVDNRNPTSLFINTAKFLFVSSSHRPTIAELSDHLPKNGVLNFATAFDDENGSVNAEISNHFTNITEVLKNIPDPELISTLYPEKLANMNGKSLTLLAHKNLPNVLVEDKKVISINTHIFEHIADKLNSTIALKIVDQRNPPQLMNDFLAMFMTREVDSTLSTIPPFLTSTPKVISYIQNGFCALVPISVGSKYNLMTLLKAFDQTGKIMFSSMIACYMIFWIIYKARGEAQGSPWILVFGFFAAIVGQGFRLRTTQVVMKLLFITFVFGSIVMSNYMQAFITSEVTKPLEEHRFESLSELFAVPNRITTSYGAHFIISYITEYKQALDDGRVLISKVRKDPDQDRILIFGCSDSDQIPHEHSENFYKFPEKLFSVYTIHDMGYLSPYTEVFQDLITKAFSAGLHQAWKTFFQAENPTITKLRTKQERSPLLTFDDLKRIFIIFPLAYSAAILLLLLEIFHYEFYTRFSWQDFMRKFAWKERKREMRVRRIQVKPINTEESEM